MVQLDRHMGSSFAALHVHLLDPPGLQSVGDVLTEGDQEAEKLEAAAHWNCEGAFMSRRVTRARRKQERKIARLVRLDAGAALRRACAGVLCLAGATPHHKRSSGLGPKEGWRGNKGCWQSGVRAKTGTGPALGTAAQSLEEPVGAFCFVKRRLW